MHETNGKTNFKHILVEGDSKKGKQFEICARVEIESKKPLRIEYIRLYLQTTYIHLIPNSIIIDRDVGAPATRWYGDGSARPILIKLYNIVDMKLYGIQYNQKRRLKTTIVYVPIQWALEIEEMSLRCMFSPSLIESQMHCKFSILLFQVSCVCVNFFLYS